MVQLTYTPFTYQCGDFIGPVANYNWHILSASPDTRRNYLTVFLPFDRYVWGLIIVSVVAVSLSLITVNKMYSKWSKLPLKETPFQSKITVLHSA